MLALDCDGPGCGQRCTGDDTARAWWLVGRNSGGIAGAVGGFVGSVSSPVRVSVVLDDGSGVGIPDEPDPVDAVEDERVHHFCSLVCVGAWSSLFGQVDQRRS